jgi:hypothetical protein
MWSRVGLPNPVFRGCNSGALAGDGGGEGDGSQFRGERRSNDTHESKTDPEAKLYRKGGGQEAKLGYLCHALMKTGTV